ncbi:dephospho-CoA kinase [Neptuniibacter sp. QD72_48]|uniref:dephospho-CoA kinase n=1 Tax=unclassified Neptuniibacter TaxID=2630693 RepID=UPI0039F5A8E6
MYIVGITGGIGSGKNAVTDRLQDLGITIVDADIVAREVVAKGEPALDKIAEHFGSHIVTESGELNRKDLREIIFRDKTAKTWLEQLLHPIIRQSIKQQLHDATSSYAVLSSPLLLETDQHELVETVIVVDASEELQLARTVKRDSASKEQIKAIMAAQLPRQERLKKADIIIDNNADLESLENQVIKLHTKLSKIAEETK